MAGARELAHVDPDLGDHGLSGGRAEPRHLLQPLDNVVKGRKGGLNAGVEGCNAVLQLLNRPQMLTEEEPMMLPVRVRSRSAWIAGGGTKFDRIRPCANRSASQVASFTSLLRPGTFFTCTAFARISVNRPSRMCQAGFQYTPVASIATCVHPALSSHSASANNPCVVVGKRRTSRSTFRLLIKAQTGHHLHLVHVETRAPLMQRLHRHLPRARPA
jgi:hypothetical protein